MKSGFFQCLVKPRAISRAPERPLSVRGGESIGTSNFQRASRGIAMVREMRGGVRQPRNSVSIAASPSWGQGGIGVARPG
jgi:hypothetical protein